MVCSFNAQAGEDIITSTEGKHGAPTWSCCHPKSWAQWFIHGLPSVFPVTRTDFFHQPSPAHSTETQNETAEEGNLGVQRRAFCCRRVNSSRPALEGMMSGEWDISTRLKSWGWKCIGEPHATYKTRRFLSPAKSVLVILVILFLSRSLQ